MILTSSLKLVSASSVMGIALFWMAHRWIGILATTLERGAVLSAIIMTAIVIYTVCSYALKSEELIFLYQTIRKRYEQK